MTKEENKKKFNSKLPSKKEIKKITRAEIIDDKEEYLVIKTVMIQDKQNINPSFKDKAKAIPK